MNLVRGLRWNLSEGKVSFLVLNSNRKGVWPSGQGGGLGIRQPGFNSRPALTCYTTIPSFISSPTLVNSQLVSLSPVGILNNVDVTLTLKRPMGMSQ